MDRTIRLFEAVDFHPVPAGPQTKPTVVRSFMAHHQGMGLLALCNTLLGNSMQKRLHAEPIVAAAELLLQERLPMFAVREPQPETSSPSGRSEGI
jgi:cyclic beta-1,2-glucan glucanotransferase